MALPVITAIEQGLIIRLQETFDRRVATVEALPGEWDDDTLKRVLRRVPGAYVAFTGGQAPAPGETYAQINGQFIVYIATGHASGEAARRTGDAQQAGAYELVQAAAIAVHGWDVDGQGTATLQRLENLYTGTLDGRGVAIYALTFEVPFTLDGVPTDLLTPFVTFDAKWDIPPETPEAHRAWLNGDTSTSAPDAEDTVVLSQD